MEGGCVWGGISIPSFVLIWDDYPNQTDPWNGTSDQQALSFAFPAI